MFLPSSSHRTGVHIFLNVFIYLGFAYILLCKRVEHILVLPSPSSLLSFSETCCYQPLSFPFLLLCAPCSDQWVWVIGFLTGRSLLCNKNVLAMTFPLFFSSTHVTAKCAPDDANMAPKPKEIEREREKERERVLST